MPEIENPSAGDGTDGVAVDELHLTLRIPHDLAEDEVEAIRRALAAGEFIDRLRRAVQTAIHSFPELSAVHLSLTR